MANLEFCDTHNMVAYLLKIEGSECFHQIVDFLNSSHIKRYLKLEDFDGISTLPNTEIFEQLALIGMTISTASGRISTAEELVSTAGASMPVSTAGRVDKEAVRLQEQLDKKEKQRITRVHEEASTFNVKEWEDIQATIKADEELALRIQAEEMEKYSEAEKARLLVDLINQRKRHFIQQRAEERRNKPMTPAQPRIYMSNYVKHMGSHTLKQLKKLSFKELKNLFEATMRRVKTFTQMECDFDKTIPKIADESSKRAPKEELEQESSKRQKTRESSEPR
uniref:Uncharacterized protein n=1 Tax=Tanacetum cinerariifolium TaxID=118510 RepID=A0A6L2JE86_TANCI|nr:hypothetical protein [Tanacetum cinerariifolium]